MISVHFYKADTLIGNVVKWFAQAEYVHCALQVDSKHMIETDFGGKVQMHHLNKKAASIIYFELDEYKEKALLATFNNLVNKRYDHAGAWALVLGIFKQNPECYTCVELVCELLEVCGFTFENKNIKPDALYKHLLSLSFKQMELQE